MVNVLPILARGYGLSAVVGVAVGTMFSAWLLAALIFWIGGAVAVLAIGYGRVRPIERSDAGVTVLQLAGPGSST